MLKYNGYKRIAKILRYAAGIFNDEIGGHTIVYYSSLTNEYENILI